MWPLLLALAVAPSEADLLLEEARSLFERQQVERAAELLRTRIEGAGAPAELARDPRLWMALGSAARACGDLETASPAFERAAEAGSGAEGLFQAVECRLEMKRAEDADLALEKLRAAFPAESNGPRAAELQGMLLFLRGREEDARPSLEKALAGGRTGAAHLLGLASFHRGDYEGALRSLDQAVRAEPGDYYSLLYRGWSLLELNRIQEAREALGQAKGVAPTAEVEYMLGRVELRAEAFEAALARLGAALEKQPDYPEAQFGLATALRRLGRAAEAREASARFRELHRLEAESQRKTYELNQRHLSEPRNAVVAEELAGRYLASGDFPSAERAAWSALGVDLARSSARLLLARALAGGGRYRPAAFHYRKILRAQPDHKEARADLEALIRLHGRKRDGAGETGNSR